MIVLTYFGSSPREVNGWTRAANRRACSRSRRNGRIPADGGLDHNGVTESVDPIMPAPSASNDSAIVLLSGPLRQGLAAALTQFVYDQGREIVKYDQYVDLANKRFFARLEWTARAAEESGLRAEFEQAIARPRELDWQLFFSSRPVRIAVFLTREIAHLYELVVPCLSGRWNAQLALAVCNHPQLESEARRFGIEFACIPIDGMRRDAAEEEQLRLLAEHDIDLVVLARYMQMVGPRFVDRYRHRIINIHHSMLPAFTGAAPYRQAWERGVKMIGATSHYVSEDLDAGPIIAQESMAVDHSRTAEELANLGRELETRVLAHAVGLHVRHCLIVDGRRTIVFD